MTTPTESPPVDANGAPNARGGMSWTVALVVLSHLVGGGILLYQLHDVLNAPREEWEDLDRKMFEYRYGDAAFLFRESFEVQQPARLEEVRNNLLKQYIPRMFIIAVPTALIWCMLFFRRGFLVAVLLGLILVAQAALACYLNHNTWDGNPIAVRVFQYELYGLGAYLGAFVFTIASRVR